MDVIRKSQIKNAVQQSANNLKTARQMQNTLLITQAQTNLDNLLRELKPHITVEFYDELVLFSEVFSNAAL